MSRQLDPTASRFAPNGRRQKDANHQASSLLATHLEARVVNLEDQHANLQDEVGTLKELFHDLSSAVDKLNKDSSPVDVKASHQDAKKFSLELEKLKERVLESVSGDHDKLKGTGSTISKPNDIVTASVTANKSIPPHMRGKASQSDNGNK